MLLELRVYLTSQPCIELIRKLPQPYSVGLLVFDNIEDSSKVFFYDSHFASYIYSSIWPTLFVIDFVVGFLLSVVWIFGQVYLLFVDDILIKKSMDERVAWEELGVDRSNVDIYALEKSCTLRCCIWKKGTLSFWIEDKQSTWQDKSTCGSFKKN